MQNRASPNNKNINLTLPPASSYLEKAYLFYDIKKLTWDDVTTECQVVRSDCDHIVAVT
jgi:hypothetical protein